MITSDNANLSDNNAITLETGLTVVKPDQINKTGISLISSNSLIRPTALVAPKTIENIRIIKTARLLENNYLTPEKDIRTSLALRGPPII